jgi:DNA-binding NarL/FixJ family response regulator
VFGASTGYTHPQNAALRHSRLPRLECFILRVAAAKDEMSITLLIVDDSKLARMIAGKAILELEPSWVRIEASNADEALRIAASRRFDAALLDLNMPGKSGLELAQALWADFPQMPIAIITANVQDEIIAAATALEVEFVSKPLTVALIRPFIALVGERIRNSAA